jgi:hypothetical protein
VDRIVLLTADMALRLAKILFNEIQPPADFKRVSPLRVEDRDDMWFVTGNGDNGRNQPPDMAHDQMKNETFYMNVFKRDSEVVNLGVSAELVVPPEIEEQMRAEARAYRGGPTEFSKDPFGKDARDLYIQQLIHGGIINSVNAATRFGALIFEYQFSLRLEQFRNLRAEEVDGLWHVYADVEGRSAEIVFRRSNAQVISLDLRPPK